MTARYGNSGHSFGGAYEDQQTFAAPQPQSATQFARQRQNSGSSMKEVFSWDTANQNSRNKVDPASLQPAGARGVRAAQGQTNSGTANSGSTGGINFFSGETNAKFNDGYAAGGKRTISEFPVNNQRTNSKLPIDANSRRTARDAKFNFFTGEAK